MITHQTTPKQNITINLGYRKNTLWFERGKITQRSEKDI